MCGGSSYHPPDPCVPHTRARPPCTARMAPHACPRRKRPPCMHAAHARRFKDAARECGNALQLAPNSAKALQRRSRSLEQQGLFKQALSDIQAVNRWGAAAEDCCTRQIPIERSIMLDVLVSKRAIRSRTAIKKAHTLARTLKRSPRADPPPPARSLGTLRRMPRQHMTHAPHLCHPRRTDTATDESLDTERRLRCALAGRRPSPPSPLEPTPVILPSFPHGILTPTAKPTRTTSAHQSNRTRAIALHYVISPQGRCSDGMSPVARSAACATRLQAAALAAPRPTTLNHIIFDFLFSQPPTNLGPMQRRMSRATPSAACATHSPAAAPQRPPPPPAPSPPPPPPRSSALRPLQPLPQLPRGGRGGPLGGSGPW